MTKDEVQSLPHGLYKIRWTQEAGGGESLAAVGSKYDGQRWLCCTNWTSSLDCGTDAFGQYLWWAVESVTLISGSPA